MSGRRQRVGVVEAEVDMDLQRAMDRPVNQTSSWRQDNAESVICNGTVINARQLPFSNVTYAGGYRPTWRMHIDNAPIRLASG